MGAGLGGGGISQREIHPFPKDCLIHSCMSVELKIIFKTLRNAQVDSESY
jgi:hypothetical protein